jgi:hypothetical protein
VTALPGPSMRDEEVPLPPEPPDEEWFYERYGDDDPAGDGFVAVVPDAAIDAERLERWRRARRVHDRPRGFVRFSLLDGPDPMGRHVGCDGEADETGARGCRAAPGEPCRTPGGRYVPGFVHPSRRIREYELFGLDAPTVTV